MNKTINEFEVEQKLNLMKIININRKKLGLSQTAIAKIVKVSQPILSYISKHKTDKVSLNLLNEINDTLILLTSIGRKSK